jgi:signal transduction histidine kinase
LTTRAGRREITVLTSGALVLVGLPLDELRAEIARMAATMGGVGAAALAVSFLGGWYLIGRALAPVHRINRTARAMIDGDFAARIPIDRIESELGQLARALNEAFDRLHAALDRQRRFTADASHELRTPLAVISTETQWALGRARDARAYHRSLEVCRRASVRMQHVVERLLALARADAFQESKSHEPIRLDELVNAVASDVRSLADAKHLHVTVDAVVPVTCLGEYDRLLDAVGNVVMNAIEYNVAEGQIRIAVRETLDTAEIVVADTGVGISAEHLPQIFEPFFRADPARRGSGGTGLGLAVTLATVRQLGGDVFCTSEPGQGTTVTIRLPRFQGRGRSHSTHAGDENGPERVGDRRGNVALRL